MVQKFDSEFHRRYVSGEGEIIEREFADWKGLALTGITTEEILAEYRKYVNDPEAELPEEIVEELKLFGKIKKTE